MRFGILTEGETAHGATYQSRYSEILKEAVAAEDAGFDFFGASQQHFIPDWCTISAPEVMYGAIAALTNRIRLRHMSEVLLNFNNPIRTAERLATEDILLNGRLEVGTARSNNRHTLDGFGIDPAETRDQWRENLEVIVGLLSSDPFEYEGKYWSIPARSLVPKAMQAPHPPFYVSADSPDTHEMAGQIGIGVMSMAHLHGWEAAQTAIDAYKREVAQAKPLAGRVTNSIGMVSLTAHCAPTREQAVDEARQVAENFLYSKAQLAKKLASSSAHTHSSILEKQESIIDEYEKRSGDGQYLLEEVTYFTIGTPDDLIEKFKRFESMGYDEVVLRIDGMGHNVNLQAIDMIGKYVIPEFQYPASIVRSRGNFAEQPKA